MYGGFWGCHPRGPDPAEATLTRGCFLEAERLFRDALRPSGQSPEDAARRATSLNNLAFALHTQGHYDAAERHYREALALREAALG